MISVLSSSITCDGGCQGSTRTCNDNSDCNVYCIDGSRRRRNLLSRSLLDCSGCTCGGCCDMDLYCPKNHDCIIDCRYRCQGLTVHAEESSTVTIQRCDYCDDLKLYCPENGAYGTDNTCSLEIYADTDNVNIYAQESFYDFTLIQDSTHHDLSSSTMHCGPNGNSYSCTFNGNGDSCTSTNSICQDYRLPTAQPTISPTNPSTSPTNIPSKHPTDSPTNIPTLSPSDVPTNPTLNPSNMPTNSPSNNPSNLPSTPPTYIPSKSPTNIPSESPTNIPSKQPTYLPSINPTPSPTLKLVITPNPTHRPTNNDGSNTKTTVFIDLSDTNDNQSNGDKQTNSGNDSFINKMKDIFYPFPWYIIFTLFAGLLCCFIIFVWMFMSKRIKKRKKTLLNKNDKKRPLLDAYDNKRHKKRSVVEMQVFDVSLPQSKSNQTNSSSEDDESQTDTINFNKDTMFSGLDSHKSNNITLVNSLTLKGDELNHNLKDDEFIVKDIIDCVTPKDNSDLEYDDDDNNNKKIDTSGFIGDDIISSEDDDQMDTIQ